LSLVKERGSQRLQALAFSSSAQNVRSAGRVLSASDYIGWNVSDILIGEKDRSGEEAKMRERCPCERLYASLCALLKAEAWLGETSRPFVSIK